MIRPDSTLQDGAGDEVGIYPATSLDIVKLLRARGLIAEFEHDREHRRYSVKEAAEIWLPVIVVACSVLINVGSNLLTDLIKDLLGAEAKNTVVHVDYHAVMPDGTDRQLRLDGKADDDLLAKIDRFEVEYGRSNSEE